MVVSMSQISKTEFMQLKDELIECGKKWIPVGEPLKKGILDNEDEKNKLWIRIFTIAMQIFEMNSQNGGQWHSVAEEEANNDALLQVLTNNVFAEFDHKKSNLYTYMNSLVEKRKIDILRKEYGRKDSGKLGEGSSRSFVSFNQKLKDDAETEFQDMLSTKDSEIELLERELNVAQTFETVAMVMKVRMSHRRKNDSSIQVWPAAFTGDVISVEQDCDYKVYIGQHRRDIDETLNDGFLDFCMNEKCKNSEDVYYGTLKKYGEIDPDSKKYSLDREIPLPIKGNIVNLFLKKSQRSFYESYNRYRSLVKELRDEKSYNKVIEELENIAEDDNA